MRYGILTVGEVGLSLGLKVELLDAPVKETSALGTVELIGFALESGLLLVEGL